MRRKEDEVFAKLEMTASAQELAAAARIVDELVDRLADPEWRSLLTIVKPTEV